MQEGILLMDELMKWALLLIVVPVSWMDAKAWEDMR